MSNQAKNKDHQWHKPLPSSQIGNRGKQYQVPRKSKRRVQQKVLTKRSYQRQHQKVVLRKMEGGEGLEEVKKVKATRYRQ